MNGNWTGRFGPGLLIGSLLLTALLLALFALPAPAAARPATPLFVTPIDGQSIEGSTVVTVYAPDLDGYNAELGVDHADWQAMNSDGSGLFSAKLNTAYYSSGKHTLTARFSIGPSGPPEVAISIQVIVQNDMPGGQALREGQRLADNGTPVPCFGNSNGKGGWCEMPGPGPVGAAGSELSQRLLPHEDGKPGIG